MTQPTPNPKVTDALLVNAGILLNGLLWKVCEFAIRAVVVLLLWNGFIVSLFSLPAMAYGHAFALVAIIAVLFSNLNAHSKFQTRHLFDLKNLVYQLIVNQHTQNTTIMGMLSRSSTKPDETENIVPKSTETVDEGNKNDYNTEESEKK